jgi:hypothetical protein
MNTNAVTESLSRIAASENFVAEAYKLTQLWESDPEGANAIDPILKFIEMNTTIDLGAPGPLVHFVERFYRSGYEEKLLQSLTRKPVVHTVNMLNRIINGTKDLTSRRRLIDVMRIAVQHPLADRETTETGGSYLARLESPAIGANQ